jgi:hypothetical protein
VRILVMLLMLAFTSQCWAATYEARALYPLVSQGIPVLERKEAGNVLHIKFKRLSKKVKDRIRELASLGYVESGVSALHTCALTIKHIDPRIKKVTIVGDNFRSLDCPVKLVILTSTGKVLYAKKVSTRSAVRTGNSQSEILSLSVDLDELGGESSVVVQFKGCEVAIRKIDIL